MAKADAHYKSKIKGKMASQFHALQDHVKAQHEKADAHYKKTLMGKMFGAANQHAVTQKEKRAHETQATAFAQTHPNRALQAGFRGFLQNVSKARKLRTARKTTSEKTAKRLELNALTRWKNLTKDERKVRYALNDRDTKSKQSTLQRWQEYTAGCKDLKSRIVTMIRGLNTRIARQALTTWKTNVQELKAQEKLAQEFAKTIGISLFNEWEKLTTEPAEATVKGYRAYFDASPTGLEISYSEVIYFSNAICFLTPEQFKQIYQDTNWGDSDTSTGIFIILDPTDSSKIPFTTEMFPVKRLI